jgi:hypothetical protein
MNYSFFDRLIFLTTGDTESHGFALRSALCTLRFTLLVPFIVCLSESFRNPLLPVIIICVHFNGGFVSS